MLDRFERELRLYEQLAHPNIITLIEIVYQPALIYIVMEYCENGDLCQQLQTYGRMDDPCARNVFRQLVNAVHYLHDRGIAHRDIKPENILLGADFSPKLADLGLCHTDAVNHLLSTPCGTPCYASPEIVRGVEYDGRATDVWSMGVVLYAMLTGALPWSLESQAETFHQILEAEFTIPPFVRPRASDLLRGMLVVDPAARLSIREVADSPWIQAPKVSTATSTAHFQILKGGELPILAPGTKMSKGGHITQQKSMTLTTLIAARPPEENSRRLLLKRVPTCGLLKRTWT
jgi:serine/threonine protein kinase